MKLAVTVGTTPDSWGVWFPAEPRQAPWHRFLDEAQQAGYEWIELGPYGYLPTRVNILQLELNRRQLRATGTFIMAPFEDEAGFNEAQTQLRDVATLLGPLGARYLVAIDSSYTDLFTGQRVANPDLSQAEWQRLVETIHSLAWLAKDLYGLQLVFHPHAETHVETEEQIERFLEDTEHGLVGLCLDVGHHAYMGGDPVAFIRRHHVRIPYLHLKNVNRRIRDEVRRQQLPFAKAVAMGVFCEPALGAVDFVQLQDTLVSTKYSGFAMVEQDMFPAEWDKPLPIARRTREYLRSIAIG